MPPTDNLKKLLFRVNLKPAPRTQSESNAVFQALQNIAPVSTFQIIRRPAPATNDVKAQDSENAVANLIFAQNSQAVDRFRTATTARRFTVTANANIPSAHSKDPYNAFGLKSRKPELEPRDIECTLTPLIDPNNSNGDRSLDPRLPAEVIAGEYSKPFMVDRNSVFAEILAKTDCPSGLIHGLLPKLEDRHCSPAHSLSTAQLGERQGAGSSSGGTTGRVVYRGSDGQKARYATDFVPLNLARVKELDSGGAASVKREDGDGGEVESQSRRRHDEFASLRNFSLARMYREAIMDSGRKDKY